MLPSREPAVVAVRSILVLCCTVAVYASCQQVSDEQQLSQVAASGACVQFSPGATISIKDSRLWPIQLHQKLSLASSPDQAPTIVHQTGKPMVVASGAADLLATGLRVIMMDHNETPEERIQELLNRLVDAQPGSSARWHNTTFILQPSLNNTLDPKSWNQRWTEALLHAGAATSLDQQQSALFLSDSEAIGHELVSCRLVLDSLADISSWDTRPLRKDDAARQATGGLSMSPLPIALLGVAVLALLLVAIWLFATRLLPGGSLRLRGSCTRLSRAKPPASNTHPSSNSRVHSSPFSKPEYQADGVALIDSPAASSSTKSQGSEEPTHGYWTSAGAPAGSPTAPGSPTKPRAVMEEWRQQSAQQLTEALERKCSAADSATSCTSSTRLGVAMCRTSLGSLDDGARPASFEAVARSAAQGEVLPAATCNNIRLWQCAAWGTCTRLSPAATMFCMGGCCIVHDVAPAGMRGTVPSY